MWISPKDNIKNWQKNLLVDVEECVSILSLSLVNFRLGRVRNPCFTHPSYDITEPIDTEATGKPCFNL